MAQEKTLRLGIVGTGIFALAQHLPSFKRHPDLFKIVSACNRTITKAEDYSEKAGIPKENTFSNLNELLETTKENIDVLIVATPVDQNLTAVELAVKNGKNVLIEKPIAHTLEAARRIVHIAREEEEKRNDGKGGVVVGVLENWPHKPIVSYLKKRIVEEKAIGEIYSFSYNMFRVFSPQTNIYLQTTWRQNPVHPGGFISDAGVHVISMFTELFGPIEQVSAFSKQIHALNGADDILTACLKTKSGILGTFHMCFAAKTEPSNELIIHGSRGKAICADQKTEIRFSLDESNVFETENRSFETEDSVEREFLDFHSVISGNKKTPLVTIEQAFHHLAVIISALESAKEGRTVQVPQP